MARPARTRSQKDDSKEPSFTDRARERQRRVRPVAAPKSQTGIQRERRGGFRRFALESYAELRKVEWPGQRHLVSATLAVIVACVVVGIFLYVADEAFSRLVKDVLLNL